MPRSAKANPEPATRSLTVREHRISPAPARASTRAAVRELDANLVAAAGLPMPVGEPLVHWSPGVRTRISGPRPLGRA